MALALGSAHVAAAQAIPQQLEQFLEKSAGLDQDEIKEVAKGDPIVKEVESGDKREVAVFGIIGVKVPRSFYVQHASDLPASLRNAMRVQVGLFSTPAKPSDMAGYALPKDDLEELKDCRPGSCKVKIPASAIAELQARLEPATPSADSAVNAYVREQVAKFIDAYRASGNQVLIEYNDKESPVEAAKVFDAMLSRSTYVFQYAPSLEKYLKNYPKDRPDSIREAQYWAVEKASGVRPTLVLQHYIVDQAPELPRSTLIASKLLYANHYYDSGLDLTAVMDAAPGGAHASDGIYVVVLHRLHFDDLPSGGLLNIRGKVIGRLKDQTETSLRDDKARDEKAYGKAAGVSP